MKRPVIVSEHAALRYLERVVGTDLDAVRSAITDIVSPAMQVGAKNVTRGGFCYVLGADGAVVTIIEANSGVQARAGARGRSMKMKDRSRRRGRPDVEPDAEMVD